MNVKEFADKEGKAIENGTACMLNIETCNWQWYANFEGNHVQLRVLQYRVHPRYLWIRIAKRIAPSSAAILDSLIAHKVFLIPFENLAFLDVPTRA